MTKIELVTAIMEATGFKKTHLMEKRKEELEAIYSELDNAIADETVDSPDANDVALDTIPTEAEETVAVEDAPTEKPKKEKKPREKKEKKPKEPKLSDREKIILATITEHPEFKGVDSVMDGKTLLKKAEELHGLPVKSSCAMFVSLKNKGYYTAKGKKSGQSKTTFQLTDLGIQYLKDNGLLAA